MGFLWQKLNDGGASVTGREAHEVRGKGATAGANVQGDVNSDLLRRGQQWPPPPLSSSLG